MTARPLAPAQAGGLTYDANGLPHVVRLASSESLAASATGQIAGTFVQITAGALDQIGSWEWD